MTSHLLNESRRLRAIADDFKERYDSLNGRREAALEGGFPGPSAELLASAMNVWLRAEMAAEQAAKLAQEEAA